MELYNKRLYIFIRKSVLNLYLDDGVRRGVRIIFVVMNTWSNPGTYGMSACSSNVQQFYAISRGVFSRDYLRAREKRDAKSKVVFAGAGNRPRTPSVLNRIIR